MIWTITTSNVFWALFLAFFFGFIAGLFVALWDCKNDEVKR